jgi:hypothetical protein
MSSLRISSPSAAAAFVLVDLLETHCGATRAEPHRDGSWQITLDLNGGSRSSVAQALSVAQEWLAQCGLPAASITIDEELHLLCDGGSSSVAMH